MLATSGSLPNPTAASEWATELKWDGMRLHVRIDGSGVVLRTRSGRDVTSGFPELAELADAVPNDAILDGEVVVFDDRGQTSFSSLQHRIHVQNPTTALLAQHPCHLIAFDLLWFDGIDATGLPYLDRRRLLSNVLTEHPNWKAPPHSLDDPQILYDLAKERGLEGVVCKKANSTYASGLRSDRWRKVKVRPSAEFAVVGWHAGSGSLSGTVGSLILATVTDDGSYDFAGTAGSGLDDKLRSELQASFKPSAKSALREVPKLDKVAHWVEPQLVVEIIYSRWDAGAPLWHPSVHGLRPDRTISDIMGIGRPLD